MPQSITNSLGNGQVAETVSKFRFSRLKPINLLALVLGVAIVGMAPQVGAQPFTNNIVIASQHPTLQAAIDAAGEQGMVIVDQDYQDLESIVLPRRLRMDGMGPRGRAVLGFDGVIAGSAISIQAPAGDDFEAWVVIENLDINGPLPLADRANVSSHGIQLRRANRVFLRNLSIHGFGVGVLGRQSSSVHVENCSVSESATDNYQLTEQSDSWRITGGWSSLAGQAGVNIVTASNTLINGVRFENNLDSAILTNGIGTHITHNWFECPSAAASCSAQSRSVTIAPGGEQTSLIDNFYGEIAPLLDNSNEQSTHRFDNRFAVQMRPAQGEDALQVRYDGESEPTVVVDDEGRLRLGSDEGLTTNARVHINADAGESGLRIRQGGATRLLVDPDGSLGIGTLSPSHRANIVGGGNAISGSNVDISELNTVFRRPSVIPGAVGIGFSHSLSSADVGAAIVHEGDANSQGSFHFATKESFAVGADLAISMTIRPTNGGNIGIGTMNPGNNRLAVDGRDSDGSTSASVRITSGEGQNQQTMLLDGNEIDGVNGLFLNNNSAENVVLATGGGNVGIGSMNPGNFRLAVNGGENDGTSASVGITSPNQTMLFDGNEIDGVNGLFLNNNSAENVVLATGGGNVGVGTMNPGNFRLAVNGTENDGTSASVRIISGAGANQQTMLFDGNEIDGVNAGLFLNNNSSENVVLATGGGNVGIGTTEPQNNLHVSSGDFTRVLLTATSPADNVQMFIDARGDGTDSGQLGTLSNHDVVMFANSQVRLVLGSDGNICIGNCP